MRIDVAIPPEARFRIEHRTGVHVGSYPDLRDVRLVVDDLHLSFGAVQGHSQRAVAIEQVRVVRALLADLLARLEQEGVEL